MASSGHSCSRSSYAAKALVDWQNRPGCPSPTCIVYGQPVPCRDPTSAICTAPGAIFEHFDQRIDDSSGVLASDFDQHHVKDLSLDQASDLNVVAAKQQVAFPVTGNGTIVCRGRCSLIETASTILPWLLVFRV